MSRKVLTHIVTNVIMVLSIKKGEKEMILVKKINELRKVIEALISLVLSLGTLASVIKMILDSIR